MGQWQKRQNCGNSTQGHPSMGLVGLGQLCPARVAAEESWNHPVRTLSGPHRTMNQVSRGNPQVPQYNGFDPAIVTMYSSSDGMAMEATWNTGTSLEPSASSAVGSSINNTHGDERGRNFRKRKSSMDLFPGSSSHRTSGIECNLSRISQAPQLGSFDAYLNSTRDAPAIRVEGQEQYQGFRTFGLPLSTSRYDGSAILPHDSNSYCPSIGQSERVLSAPALLPASDVGNVSVGNIGTNLSESSMFRQTSGSSGSGSWHRISAYMDEGNSQSGFLDSRNFNSTLAVNPYRQGEESDVLDGPSYERRQHPPLNRLIRPRHLTSQHSAIPQHLVPSPHAYIGTVNNYPSFSAAHSNRYHNNIHAHLSFPPPGSVAAMNGVPSGPQTAFGDLSMAGQFIPRYNDLNRTTNSRQHVSLRASRVLPSEMLDGLRFSGPHNELINQSVPYEWTEAYDQHSDMRLDVDNMTYEELLALEERIGNVSTGLDGEDVQKCLKTTKHSSAVITITKAEDNDLKCSICQEEYEEGDELGELKCGHGYHTDCIKQWLQLKNQCPICKASAC
ncbi:hypothetical protein KP509_13G060600 [Ceratopteris richardii]|nr:hypothetical protein KP509_13G060600 [Ceratopteris richardii]KAH7421499.1 hypothetical protein KP509_13G060600 [Ceratopteris richardii]KAH7421502.1 hypothetical protein KP509_13G060600 [Ceratopteris richardii]KAH7421503.1 hypothetical protein KP509_13G060600 [Ceratopteris richardii]KAH7421504.1 hypothetical protein KP509_13G060600 [Ceratopteris richardii]